MKSVLKYLSDKNPCISWLRNCCFNQLKEYEALDKEGRLVVLPCKVGDTVYVIAPKYKNCLIKYNCDKYNPEEYLITWCENYCPYGYRGIGVIENIVDAVVILKDKLIYQTSKCGYVCENKIYLSQEEAEKVLREMKNIEID